MSSLTPKIKHSVQVGVLKAMKELDLVVHACNLSTQEAEEGLCEFVASLVCSKFLS